MRTVHQAVRDRRVGAIPGLLLLAILPVLVVLASSCGGDVTQEELDAERAMVADIQTRVDDAEVQIALVQSQLAQSRAQVADLVNLVAEAEVREVMLAAFLAWNRKDMEVFRSSFTDQGIADSVMSLPDSIGDPSIGLRRVMETEVSDDKATIHVMFGLGTQRNSVRQSLVKTNGGWRIDAEERLSPKIKEGTPTVDIQLDECSLESGTTELGSGNVALRLVNAGEVARHLIFTRVRDELDLSNLAGGQIPAADTAEVVAHVHSLQPGEVTNIAFTAPLRAGRYALVCSGPSDAGRGVVGVLIVP